MRKVWWLWVAAAAVAVGGCNSGRLVPKDIEKLMESEGGRWALKSIEGHGGIWRWRQRPYMKFDYSALAIARGMDTAITNRRRDTTITPRVDTLINLREQFTVDLGDGRIFARSAQASPVMSRAYNGDSVWVTVDGVPQTDSAVRAEAMRLFLTTRFEAMLPFSLLDTTLSFTLVGSEAYVDTTTQKGKLPGTYDTTLTPMSMIKLKDEYKPGQAPYDWLVFWLDERDGKIRRVLAPARDPQATAPARLTLWTELEDAVGLTVGGRRRTFPADSEGRITGEMQVDRRYYNFDFPRQLEKMPFDWTPPPSAGTAPAAGGAQSP